MHYKALNMESYLSEKYIREPKKEKHKQFYAKPTPQKSSSPYENKKE